MITLIIQDLLRLIIDIFEILFKIKSTWLCQFRLSSKEKPKYYSLLTVFRQTSLNFKSGKQRELFSLSLCFWKNIYFVFSAFSDNSFIETPFKNIFEFFTSYFKRMSYVTMRRKTCVVCKHYWTKHIYWILQISNKSQENKKSQFLKKYFLHDKK